MHGDLVDVAGRLIHAVYPGIEYWPSQTDTILNELARPELLKKYGDTLGRFKSEAEALSACGNRMNVDPLRPCDGTQWEAWHIEKIAMTEANEQRRLYALLEKQWELAA